MKRDVTLSAYFHTIMKGFRVWNKLPALYNKGAIIFFGRGVPNLQKVSINKSMTPPISATKIL